MPVIPASWMPNSSATRIICHWTAGGYTAGGLAISRYHILIQGDGSLKRGTHSIKDNDSTADGVYGKHTKGTNKNSIGVSMCCMAGANESPFNAGAAPMKKLQWDAMIDVVAQLCKRYDIACTPTTVLGHGEVEANLGIDQEDKWDPMKLPFDAGKSKAQVGTLLRQQVSALLD